MRTRSRRRARAGAVLAGAVSAALVSALTFGAIAPAQADDGIAEPASAQEDAVAAHVAGTDVVVEAEPPAIDAAQPIESVKENALDTDRAPLNEQATVAEEEQPEAGGDDTQEPTEHPQAPRIDGIDLVPGGATIRFSSPTAGGRADTYTVEVSGLGGNSDILTQSQSEVGAFVFVNLEPGGYGVTLTASNAAGSGVVEGYSFVIPDTTSAPIIDGLIAEDTGVTLMVHNVNDELPLQTGPTARASALYHLTLSDGVDVYEQRGSAFNSSIGYYNFLKPGTTYAVTLTVSYYFEGSGLVGPSDPAEGSFTTTEPKAPIVPVAPSADALIDANRDEVSVPSSALAGSKVTVRVDPALAGASLYGWLFSDPTALGVAIVQPDGSLTFTIPTSISVGTHRLALTSLLNDLIGWGFVEIRTAIDDSELSGVGSGTVNVPTSTWSRPASGELARTGGDAPIGLVGVGGLLLMAGVGLLVARRRKS